MPKRRFEGQPIDRNDQHWQTQEEHDAWVRRCWATWGRAGTPEPCDCGQYADRWLVLCEPGERARCKVDAPKRMEERARRQHLDGLAAKRKFPGMGPTPPRHCYWCKQPIVHGRVGQRAMHDGRLDEPDCRWQHDLRTRLETQQRHLLGRDGMGCRDCGAVIGAWAHPWSDLTDEAVQKWWNNSAWARSVFPICPGPFTYIRWDTGLEVDHFIALAVAWAAFPEDSRRRWFFSPANLRLLCTDCHKAKTQRDRALLRAIAVHGPEFARAEVLRLLADTGLLRPARPRGQDGAMHEGGLQGEGDSRGQDGGP